MTYFLRESNCSARFDTILAGMYSYGWPVVYRSIWHPVYQKRI